MLGVNEKYRYLPRDVLEYLSFQLEIPFSAVYRIATFWLRWSAWESSVSPLSPGSA